METMKIGFFEVFNSKANTIEKSSNRLKTFLALVVGLSIAAASVVPGVDVSLGDAWPMVVTLLGYSLGSSGWEKTAEMVGNKSNK